MGLKLMSLALSNYCKWLTIRLLGLSRTMKTATSCAKTWKWFCPTIEAPMMSSSWFNRSFCFRLSFWWDRLHTRRIRTMTRSTSTYRWLWRTKNRNNTYSLSLAVQIPRLLALPKRMLSNGAGLLSSMLLKALNVAHRLKKTWLSSGQVFNSTSCHFMRRISKMRLRPNSDQSTGSSLKRAIFYYGRSLPASTKYQTLLQSTGCAKSTVQLKQASSKSTCNLLLLLRVSEWSSPIQKSTFLSSKRMWMFVSPMSAPATWTC